MPDSIKTTLVGKDTILTDYKQIAKTVNSFFLEDVGKKKTKTDC